MTGKETAFFAIENDLDLILIEIEEDFDIKYVKSGRFTTNEPIVYSSFSDIPYLGYTDSGDWAGSDHRFLITAKDSVVQMEKVVQRKGGVLFFVDPELNSNSIELTVNGIYTKKQNVIIAGRTAIVSKDGFAKNLYKSLSSKLKKKFKRIGGYYVGPKAEEKLKQGWRLVQIEKAPKEYDLVYPDK